MIDATRLKEAVARWNGGDATEDDELLFAHCASLVLAAQAAPGEHAERIGFIADYIEKRWIDWDREQRAKEGMTTDRDTAIMSLPGIDDLLPVPVWPSHGQLGNWVKALREAALALHRPVEARVTEETVCAFAKASYEDYANLSANELHNIHVGLEAALALPSPQVTREEVHKIVDDPNLYAYEITDRIMALFARRP